MDKALVFDTGPIISLATNNLLWMLPKLKEKFGGSFYITPKVREELLDRPLKSKKFRFEAIQLLPLISDGVLQVYESETSKILGNKMLDVANACFEAKNNWIKILHPAEMEVIAAALELKAAAIVVDETATRYLIESPNKLIKRLERKLHTKIVQNKDNLNTLKSDFKGLKVIRSFELSIMGYELGLFDGFLKPDYKKLDSDLEKDVLSGMLWALKLNGCSVKSQDIVDVVALESKLK